jgi:tetratricopeptide (TPR) repeat protein
LSRSAAPEGDSQATRTHPGTGALLETGQLLAGRYRILHPVGVGAMGMVYRARDEQLDVEVAVKVLRPELASDPAVVERFRRELVLARQVSHEKVVRIHDIGRDGDTHFLTMDYVAARSLKEVLARDGRLPAERVVGIARQLAAALAAAHARGVVHRDLKPANILLEEGGNAYVTDFGVARSLSSSHLTRAGAVVGTPAYLAPEQARGDEVDGRADLYSLGVVCFEMLAGELPFAGSSEAELLAQRLTGRLKDFAQVGVEVPAWLAAVIRRCLAGDPRDRYPGAAELGLDLERGTASGSRRSWRRSAVLAAGLALLAAAFALYPHLRPWAASPTAPTSSPVRSRHAVAVLPLADETGREDLAWTSGGVAELLVASLAESSQLRVVDPERVLRTALDVGLPRGHLSQAEVQRAAELLDADRLVVGRVRSLDGGVRVDLQLLAAQTPAAAAALAAERPRASGVFDLVAELGAALRRRLELPEEVSAPPSTSSSEALRAYSLGLDHLRRGSAVAAVPALEASTREDPTFASAWLRLAEAYGELGYRERAVAAASRATSLLGGAESRLALEARAREAALAGRPEEAQRLLQSLTERFPHDVEARMALAEAYAAQGNLDSSITALETVVASEPHHPRAWYLLGRSLIESGQTRRAVEEVLVRALVIQNQLGNESGKAEVLNALGVGFHEQGSLEQAVTYYAEAAELREKLGDRRGYATSLKNLAAVAVARGDFAAAGKNLETAARIHEEIGDPAGLARVEISLGGLEEGRGRYGEALAHYRRSLQLRRDLGDDLALAEAYNNVGYANYLLGDFDNGRVYWQQALDLSREGGDRIGVVLATQSLALLELARGGWDRAAKAFAASLSESRELAVKDATAVALGHLGRVAHCQGRYRAALEAYREARALLEELGDPRGRVEFALFEAETLLALGLAEEARERLALAEKILSDRASHEQRADLLRLQGELALARGETASARQAFAAAEREAALSSGLVAQLAVRLSLARAKLAQGDARASLDEARRVAAEAERVGHALTRLSAAEAQARAELALGLTREAGETVRRALALARECGTYGGAFRLHALAARAAEGGEAVASWRLAAEELERLARELLPRERQALERMPEVMEIGEHAPPPSLAERGDG